MSSPRLLAFASIFAVASVPSVASAGGAMLALDNGALEPPLCGGGCWTNHLRVTDIDGDDDLDALFANYDDFFGGQDDPQPLGVYSNDGAGVLSDVSARAVGGISTNAHQICVGDVDGDGSGDLYVPDGSGMAARLMMNDGDGAFTDEADTRLPAAVPRAGACRFGDVDGDGDLDLVVASGYGGGSPTLVLYENDGVGVFDHVEGAFSGAISGSDIDDIEVFDADRDYDLDVFANAHGGGSGGLYINDGSGAFAVAAFPAPGPGSNFHYNAALCDVDGDGDLDMWIDNTGGGYTEQLLINDGAGAFTDETGARVSGNAGVDDNGVVCVDLDNDGDFDGVVLSLDGPERFLENDGNGNFAVVAGTMPGGGDSTLWGEFGDLDGDGRLDLVTGQGEFGDQINKVYLGTDAQPVDDTAPVIIATQAGAWAAGEDPVVRFAVSDRAMSDEGPRLNRAYVRVEGDGVDEEIVATFVGGDLFRAVLPTVPEGGYTMTACAEDPGGNNGCGDPIAVAGDGGTGSGSGGMDTGDDMANDTADDTAEGRPDDTADDLPDGGPDDTSDDGPGDASGGTSTGDGGGDGEDDPGGGCACASAPAPRFTGWWMLGLLAIPCGRRRRCAGDRVSPDRGVVG